MSKRNSNPSPERDLLAHLEDADTRVEPSPRLRELLLSATPGRRFEGFVPRMAAFFDLGVERARELLDRVAAASEAPWEPDQVAGVRLLHFDGGPRLAGTDCGLVHIEPDVEYPLHHHRGDEWAFVLQGSAVEDTGRVWEPGDLLRNPAGSQHSFRTRGSEPFVFAVVLHDRIEIQKG